MQVTYKTIRPFVRLLSVLSALLLLVPSASVSAAVRYELPPGTTLHSQAVLLVSLGPSPEQDMPLYEMEADAKRSPAALVRLMVGITAIQIIREKGIDMDTVTGKYTMQEFQLIAGSNLATAAMEFGEEWTVRDLLSISMLHTAADVCVTLAVTLSGSHSQFIAEMNALAAEIGCKSTFFENVTGQESPGQYTTARDMYRIIRYGMDFPEYEPLFAATQYTCHPVSEGSPRTYVNSNEMQRSTTPYYYAPMAFGKTGFTNPAGRCLASVARDSGYEYLCVVMGAPNLDQEGKSGGYFTDTRTLYRWAFNNFTYKTLRYKNLAIRTLPVDLSWERDGINLVLEADFSAIVPDDLDLDTVRVEIPEGGLPSRLTAPIVKGEVYGKADIIVAGEKIGEVNLVAGEDASRSEILAAWAQIQSFLASPWFYAGLAMLVLLLAGYVLLNVLHNRKRRRKRMKRVRRR